MLADAYYPVVDWWISSVRRTSDIVAAAVSAFDVFCRVQEPNCLSVETGAIDPASCGHQSAVVGFLSTCGKACATERGEIEPEKDGKEDGTDSECDGQRCACLAF